MDYSINTTTTETTLVFAIVFIIVIGSIAYGILTNRKRTL